MSDMMVDYMSVSSTFVLFPICHRNAWVSNACHGPMHTTYLSDCSASRRPPMARRSLLRLWTGEGGGLVVGSIRVVIHILQEYVLIP